MEPNKSQTCKTSVVPCRKGHIPVQTIADVKIIYRGVGAYVASARFRTWPWNVELQHKSEWIRTGVHNNQRRPTIEP